MRICFYDPSLSTPVEVVSIVETIMELLPMFFPAWTKGIKLFKIFEARRAHALQADGRTDDPVMSTGIGTFTDVYLYRWNIQQKSSN